MSKPQPKREMAIHYTDVMLGVIILWASKDALEDIKQFGMVTDHSFIIGKDGYWLKVDGRYDFSEVLAYIQNY